MSGTALHGWPGAWRLFWSFVWRQALALFAGSGLLGILLATLRKAGLIKGSLIISSMPMLTTALLVMSCVVSFRFILDKFEVRLPGGPVEQDRRHRR